MSLRRFPLLLALLFALGCAGCGERPTGGPAAAQDPDAALKELWAKGNLYPLERGARWTYAARLGEKRYEISAKRVGGDVRERDGRRIRYEFFYGDYGDEIPDAIKSIVAAPQEGPEEFYFDAFDFSVHHDPPVALLPKEPKVGARWTWTGSFDVEPGPDALPNQTTTLEVKTVEAVETRDGPIDAVRIDEQGEGFLLSRWFAPGIGIVRYRFDGTFDGTRVDFDLTLTSFEAP